jgi:adenosine deaminase
MRAKKKQSTDTVQASAVQADGETVCETHGAGGEVPAASERGETLAEIRSFIQRLPKTDLHIHLDGSLRVRTLHELIRDAEPGARQEAEDAVRSAFGERVDLQHCSEEALRRVVEMGDRAENLEQYLVPFAVTGLVLQDPANLERVSKEIVLDAAAQNVRYLELRFAPMLHTRRNAPLDAIMEAVLRGLRQGEAESPTPIKTGLIVCGMRQNVDETIVAAELACIFKEQGVLAFDIAGPERNNPPDNHLAAFKIIQNHMLRVTVHAGEGYGPRSIRSALYDVVANRLGHGTRVSQDGDLFRYVVNTRIPLEMCLSSNVHTRTVHSYQTHPAISYLRRGVRVTLNTDNTLISATTINDEYEKTWLYLHATKDELKAIALNGFNSSFQDYAISNPLREEMRRTIRDIV